MPMQLSLVAKHLRLFLAIGCATAFVSGYQNVHGQNRTKQQSEEFLIDGIRMHLVLARTGALSPDLSSVKADALRNINIAKASFGSPAISMLVLVHVTAKAETFDSRRAMALVARQAGKRIGSYRAELGTVGPDGFFASFLVPAGGCAAIEVEASIVGQSTSSSIKRTIPFNCGE